jgi:hypothetical protein
MASALNTQDIKAILDEIDRNLEQMANILQTEEQALNKSFGNYLVRIRQKSMVAEPDLARKLEGARVVFQRSLDAIKSVPELAEPLSNLLEVNKMVRLAVQDYEGNMFVKISSYIGSIANICLGQLKYIRMRYEAILVGIREEIRVLWMDRELSRALRLILSVNQMQFKKFTLAFHQAEVLYADISLIVIKSENASFHQRIVLRMVSNRLPSVEEQQIIHTLFPGWEEKED